MTDPMFPTVVYLLCFATSATCALLLGRSYRRSGARLLLWSTACFALLALNNLLLVIDLVLLTEETDLALPRQLAAAGAVAVLLFGFIWDMEEDA